MIINTFNSVKMILIIVSCSVTALTIFTIKSSFDSAESQRETIYMSDSKNTIELALSNDLWVNRPKEAEAHVKRFHDLFFFLSPDANQIERNMQRAIAISDKSVYQQYLLMKEKNYFEGLIANGISSEVMCDSINVTEVDKYNYDVKMYGKQALVDSDKIIYKELVTTCNLYSCHREIENPNGFVICNFTIKNSNILGTMNRKNLNTNEN